VLRPLEDEEQPSVGKLLDAALHPSGEVTALLASDAGFALARYDASGALRAAAAFRDDAIAKDPPAMKPGESQAPIEEHLHDAGRIAADGEGLFLATRTGRHSVVAYGLRFEATGCPGRRRR
jgi:hypothetical protein